MPNSAPATRQAMLDALGIQEVEELYSQSIPEELRYRGTMDIPKPIVSEYALQQHVNSIINRNNTCEEYDSYLGAGCYNHYVPAICDEINSRSEFLTGYCGDTYSDHGKMQAIFEYASMMGELLDADAVSYTTYDAGQSVVSSMRIALRVQEARNTPKDVVLVPATMNPEILSQAKEYCRNVAQIRKVAYDPATGLMDMRNLEDKLKEGNVGAVFYENPSYLGFFETQGQEIAELAHEYGALCIAQPEVSALGIMESPMNQGADLVCGDIQPLGMHIQFGGGQAGFIACRQDVELLPQKQRDYLQSGYGCKDIGCLCPECFQVVKVKRGSADSFFRMMLPDYPYEDIDDFLFLALQVDVESLFGTCLQRL